MLFIMHSRLVHWHLNETEVEEVLSSLYWLFVDSPARKEDFTEITGSMVFPLKFCKHRWLENVPVSVVWAQEIWEKVIMYVQKVQTGKKYATPTSQSFKMIRERCSPGSTHGTNMAAFESVAKQLQPFLAIFQSDNPLIYHAAHNSWPHSRKLMMTWENWLRRVLTCELTSSYLLCEGKRTDSWQFKRISYILIELGHDFKN